MDLVLSDSGFSFKCSRQFPTSLYFATTINKNQDQLLSKVGWYLRRPVFTHGQLYVVASKVAAKIWLKLLILEKDDKTYASTINVVYP